MLAMNFLGCLYKNEIPGTEERLSNTQWNTILHITTMQSAQLMRRTE